MKPKGITICVEYDDLLEMTLRNNMQHLSECVVVTSLADQKTVDVVNRVPGARVFRTDAFTRYGAKFNKGLAMEEGLNELGRDGWILIWDADIVFPPTVTYSFDVASIDPENLYGVPRLICENPAEYARNESSAWDNAHETVDKEFPGYFQLFSASSSYLKDQPYWYDPTFVHAGGGDAWFQTLWPEEKKIRLSSTVLHLGPRDRNWYGRTTVRLDGTKSKEAVQRAAWLKRLQRIQGWLRQRAVAAGWNQSTNDRVKIPGVTSTFQWGKSDAPE